MLKTRPIVTRETEQVLCCDVCSVEIESDNGSVAVKESDCIIIKESDFEWNGNDIGYTWGFCKECAEITPKDVIEGLTSTNSDKRMAAAIVVYSIDQLSYEHKNLNLSRDKWAFFHNQDSDYSISYEFEDEQDLLRAIDNETVYPRSCAAYLSAVLIYGKLANYKAVMTLDIGDFKE